jgi:hypothetical protein
MYEDSAEGKEVITVVCVNSESNELYGDGTTNGNGPRDGNGPRNGNRL